MKLDKVVNGNNEEKLGGESQEDNLFLTIAGPRAAAESILGRNL
jgi:hypothetical protein